MNDKFERRDGKTENVIVDPRCVSRKYRTLYEDDSYPTEHRVIFKGGGKSNQNSSVRGR